MTKTGLTIWLFDLTTNHVDFLSTTNEFQRMGISRPIIIRLMPRPTDNPRVWYTLGLLTVVSLVAVFRLRVLMHQDDSVKKENDPRIQAMIDELYESGGSERVPEKISTLRAQAAKSGDGSIEMLDAWNSVIGFEYLIPLQVSESMPENAKQHLSQFEGLDTDAVAIIFEKRWKNARHSEVSEFARQLSGYQPISFGIRGPLIKCRMAKLEDDGDTISHSIYLDVVSSSQEIKKFFDSAVPSEENHAVAEFLSAFGGFSPEAAAADFISNFNTDVCINSQTFPNMPEFADFSKWDGALIVIVGSNADMLVMSPNHHFAWMVFSEARFAPVSKTFGQILDLYKSFLVVGKPFDSHAYFRASSDTP